MKRLALDCPVVFLDFDGVMGAGRVWAQNASKRWTCPAGWVDPAMIARLNRLVRRTGARVVVSSSWRRYLGADGVAAVLSACGFVGEVLGATSVIPGDPASWRGREIDRWLMAHPRVRAWVVLDDLGVSVDAGRLVRTDTQRGLTDEDVDRAVAVLSSTPVGSLFSTSAEILVRPEAPAGGAPTAPSAAAGPAGQ